MLASIVIPSRGRRHQLPVLFAALERQTVDDFEAIVVCDGDIDDTAGLVEAWRHRIPVRSIVFPENRGRPAALNAGFGAARGDVLIRCDDDLEPRADFVERHAAHHAGEPTGVVGPCRDRFANTRYARIYGRPADTRTAALWRSLPADQTWRCWSANVSTTRETFDRIGPYDGHYRRYGWEDIDWGYRLHLAGVPIVVADDVTCAHDGPATSASDRAAKSYLSGLSKGVFEAKHGMPHSSQCRTVSPWNCLVWLTSRPMLGERSVRRIAGLADRLLPVLPRPLATKAVALGVEAAGDRGQTRKVS